MHGLTLVILIVLVGIPLWALIGRFVWWSIIKFDFILDPFGYIISHKTFTKLFWPGVIIFSLILLVIHIVVLYTVFVEWCWKGSKEIQ